MIDFSQIQMGKVVIHKVGNKLREEGIIVSPNVYHLTDGNVEELLLKYFLSSFKQEVFYKFYHETDIHLHELYMYASHIFINSQTFYEESVHIAKHLYEQSIHPQVKGGECYVAYFSDCIVNEQKVDAIGIFKTESKEKYLKVTNQTNEFTVDADMGINIRKLDKGCIIFNIESVDGYRILIVDNVTKGNKEAQYWRENFLRVADVQDEYFQTQNYLGLCRDFAENVYGEVYQADKKDQVVFMNEAITYFDKNHEFQLDDFVQQVVKQPELIEQFKDYKQVYDLNQGIDGAAAFSISNQAVKTAKRKFKNLIKLDNGIEIKIKAAAELGEMNDIEQGYDEQKGMRYYKIFFHEEE